mmetsp:Transcript_17382/g.38007  ORF Transcript_17382/g.38007 Transcript_17382/m.38007 type:complete len:176 (-) Transcript_17382:186-713(-)
MSLSMLMLVVAAASASASTLIAKSARLPQYHEPCPFGYGTHCQMGKIDSATKAEVANILSGILSKLSSKKGLMQSSQTLSKVTLSSSATDSAMREPVRKAIQSLLAGLRSVEQEPAAALAALLSESYPDLFADSESGSLDTIGHEALEKRPIDTRTKEQVASILEGILKNLSKRK